MGNSTIGFNQNQNPVRRQSAIEKEFKQIDKFKERQKIELQALIQHNLMKHIKKKENEEKARLISQRTSIEKGLFNKTNMMSNLKLKK